MTAVTSAIRLLIIEDSSLVRHGIRTVLENEPAARGMEIVGEADTAATARSAVEQLIPDVVLLDLRLPDDSGLNVCRFIRQRLPKICVIVLTASMDDRSIYEAVVAGAQGYLSKDIDPASLIQAIEDGHAGRPVFPGDVTNRVLNSIRENQSKQAMLADLAALSPQEQRVLATMANGHTNKEIAEIMGLSDNTVKNYSGNLFAKLGVTRRAQAVALYLRHHPGRAEPSADSVGLPALRS